MPEPTLKRAAAPASPPETATTLLYTRVSTESQAEEDRTSLADQERACRAVAAKRNREVDYVWSDPGISGRDEDRLERLTRWCEAHPRTKPTRGLIIVLNASRWGRFVTNPHASGFFKYRLTKAGWAVEFAQQPSTGNRTTDGVLGVIHDSQAAAESEEKAYRARQGMAGQVRQGHWVCRAPYGYDRVAVSATGKPRPLAPGEHAAHGERVKLVLGPPHEVRAVKHIFTWYAAGMGVEEIARKLNHDGVPGAWIRYPKRRGSKYDTPPAWRGHRNVIHILRRRAYTGDLVWWPTEDGQRVAEPIVVEGAWPQIVSRELWDTVQARLAGPKRVRATAGRYLLAGLLTCQCGAPFVGGGGSRPKAKDPEACMYYVCGKCRRPMVTINKAWLEARVVELVTQHVRSVLKGFDAALDEVLVAEQGSRRHTRRNVAQERQQLLAERGNVVRAISQGTITDDEAKAQLGTIRQQLATLDGVSDSRFAEAGATVTPKERQALKAMAVEFAQRIQRADPAAARSLLGYWLRGITIDASDPKARTGRLILSRLPLQGLESSSKARHLC